MASEGQTIFTTAFLIQTAASGVAILVLTGIAAWAHLSKPMPSLDEGSARRILADEFPGKPLEGVWISDDGRSAVARAEGVALIIYAAGDGYIARHLPWDQVSAFRSQNGRVAVRMHDFAAPRADLAFASWPPN